MRTNQQEVRARERLEKEDNLGVTAPGGKGDPEIPLVQRHHKESAPSCLLANKEEN